MNQTSLFSIIESSMHPNFSDVYARLGIAETKFNSIRKTMSKLKTHQPDYIVAEFFYGYGSNYAGVNISNLDVLLSTLQRYSPTTKMIVLVDKSERKYVEKLNEILPLYAVLQLPVKTAEFINVLQTPPTPT